MIRGWWPVDFCFCLVTWSLVFLGCYSVFKLLQTLPLVREPSCFSDQSSSQHHEEPTRKHGHGAPAPGGAEDLFQGR